MPKKTLQEAIKESTKNGKFRKRGLPKKPKPVDLTKVKVNGMEIK